MLHEIFKIFDSDRARAILVKKLEGDSEHRIWEVERGFKRDEFAYFKDAWIYFVKMKDKSYVCQSRITKAERFGGFLNGRLVLILVLA